MDYLISIPDQLVPQLRSLRKARGLSQVDLALKLGLSQSRIAAIERNPAAVSTGQLLALLKVLGVDLVLREAAAPAGATTAKSDPADSASAGQW